MCNNFIRTIACVACAAAALSVGVVSAFAEDDDVLTLDIERQDAGSALMELARSSGAQIMLRDEVGVDVELAAVRGEYTFEEALAVLLAGSGLEYRFTSDDVVLVQPIEENEEEAEGPAATEEEEPLQLAGGTVTGTRLPSGDATTRVYSLTAEEIARRGVASTEELMRTLPWNMASITTQNNTRLDQLEVNDATLDGVALGTSTVNLRNLGSANTLVLINGRRVASRAGEEDSLVNLLTVPLSSIERVEIQLDGASAVYGSDAIGGVVNFITKKDYRGASVTVRNEFSSTDADRSVITLRGGYAWFSGNVTATLSRKTSKPINNLKLWTSSDYRHLLGPEFDARSKRIGQPGVVRRYCGSGNWGWPCGPRMQLPAGHSGVGATVEDFSTDIALVDRVSPFVGEDSTSESVSLNLEQYVTDSFRIYVDAMYSRLDSFQETSAYMRNWVVPASNAYNPFGQTVSVSYWPKAEIDSGTLSAPFIEAENELRNFSVGFHWDFWDDEKLEVNATRSRSNRFAWQLNYYWLDTLNTQDPTRLTIRSALASSDPGTALNLFGDGSAQGSRLGVLFGTPGAEDGVSITTSYEPVLRGQLFDLWGGPLAYAAGAEYRRETSYVQVTYYASDGTFTDTNTSHEILTWGLEEPTRELTAYFVEFIIPFVGADNARPGLRDLRLSLKGRRDTYKTTGASGGVTYDYLVEDFVGEPRLVSTSKSANSPWVGLIYKPLETLTLRANWSKAFRPPVYSDLFDRENSDPAPDCYLTDPYDPDGESDCFLVDYRSANLELESEFSNSFALGIEWTPDALPGLLWTVDWSFIDYENQIENSYFLLLDYPEIGFRIPQIVERNAEGRVTTIYVRNINLAESVNETIDFVLEYRFDSRWGNFTPRLNYTRVLDEFIKVAPEFEEVSSLGTLSGSDRYQLTGHLTWEYGRIAADVFLRYTPGYLNRSTGDCIEEVGRCSYEGDERPDLQVDDFLTVDLVVTYSFDNGFRVRAGGRNVLDADPPLTVTGWREPLPYDSLRYDARGQVLFIELNWEF